MAQSQRISSINEYISSHNTPSYHGKQLLHGLYTQGKTMQDILELPIQLRNELTPQSVLSLMPVSVVSGDQAERILFHTKEGHPVESVRLTYKSKHDNSFHYSLCVSSQSGCALGCQFCATGALGLMKNLSVDEIVDQYLYFIQNNKPIDSIIFMGMGEPFANAPNVFEALKILTDSNLCGLSPRRISVSTVGLIPGIKELAQRFPTINLAFSLHSPYPEQRKSLMPITNSYPIDKVFDTLNAYIQKTNNKVFIAYLLLAGVNDSLDHAAALAELIKNQGKKSYLYHVNLIRYNPGPSKTAFIRPDTDAVKAFQDKLHYYHITVTLRQDFGVSIAAACGQLAAINKNEPISHL